MTAEIIDFGGRTSGPIEERRALERQIAAHIAKMYPLLDRVNEITRLLGDEEERRGKSWKDWKERKAAQ